MLKSIDIQEVFVVVCCLVAFKVRDEIFVLNGEYKNGKDFNL